MHPKKFISKLEKYLNNKRIRKDLYLLEVENILSGNAKAWFSNKTFASFEAFKIEFTNKFYNDPMKTKFKDQWMNQKYDNKITYDVYFESQVREAEYIEPAMSIWERNKNIVEQLPVEIQNRVSIISFDETEKIIKALEQFSLIKNKNTEIDNNNNKNTSNNNNEQNKSRNYWPQNQFPQSNWRDGDRYRGGNHTWNRPQGQGPSMPVVDTTRPPPMPSHMSQFNTTQSNHDKQINSIEQDINFNNLHFDYDDELKNEILLEIDHDAEEIELDESEKIVDEMMDQEEYVQHEILHDEEYEIVDESEKITSESDDKAGEKMFDEENEEMVDAETKIIIDGEIEKITNEPEKIVDEMMDQEEYIQYEILHAEEYEQSDILHDEKDENMIYQEAEKKLLKKLKQELMAKLQK
ncbi:hypothetical protein HCN44_006007 [Aphidius gifuensis]|uniref:Uncharacterized protein n=1 Tax=Aphidius gifuensis TaxID=684658 RepID=A0A834Y2I4_APHGI|nr:hypothetical protein HCN44_006007 [Aphidius gifuensis]